MKAILYFLIVAAAVYTVKPEVFLEENFDDGEYKNANNT